MHSASRQLGSTKSALGGLRTDNNSPNGFMGVGSHKRNNLGGWGSVPNF